MHNNELMKRFWDSACSWFRWILAVISTIPRDIEGLYILLRVNLKLRHFSKKKLFVSDLVRNQALSSPDKVCFHFEGEIWTFRDVDEYANRVADYFRTKLDRFDVVGILMDNCPQYVAIWLGLSRLGVVSALLNTKLKKDSYLHCLRACNCCCLLFDRAHVQSAFSISGDSFTGPFYLVDIRHDDDAQAAVEPYTDPDFNFTIINDFSESSGAAVDDAKVSADDLLLLIFTSGTTGMPKAARIKHSRFMLGAVGCFYGQKIKSDDVIYNTLPLYHALGGWICVGFALVFGVRVVIRKKFSATNFWRDCVVFNCTVFMYIGELCKYIVATQYSPFEDIHMLRAAVGNGMRTAVWKEFSRRFKVPLIVEFYAATESNAYFFNFKGSPVGSCGFNSIILPWILPLILVKCDQESGDVIRTQNTNLCVKAPYNEPGLLLSPISNSQKQRFDGYKSEEDTSKKIISNVLRANDKFFDSGDVFVQDDKGHFYFKDRMGDTFRWCGENVSTFEVETILSQHLSNLQIAVYGTMVKGHDGRACMAAVTGPFNPDLFAKYAIDKLAWFAVPIFVRHCDHIEMTSTFKLSKLKYKQEGLDHVRFNTQTSDRFYYMSKSRGCYECLTPEIMKDIEDGKIRL